MKLSTKSIALAHDAKYHININVIANSIEKAHKTLQTAREIGNIDAIMTWERILASLQLRWQDAMIEVETNGRYTFE